MANTKISALSNASALGGTERLAGEQAGGNVNITPAQIKTYTNSDLGGLLFKVLEISDWNMNSSSGGSATKSVAHGLADHTKIRGIFPPIIRNDDGSSYNYLTSLENGSPGEGGVRVTSHDATNIRLYAEGAGLFDDASYNATGGYVRGWITIAYVA
jgi:hypothetical protein